MSGKYILVRADYPKTTEEVCADSIEFKFPNGTEINARIDKNVLYLSTHNGRLFIMPEGGVNTASVGVTKW